MAAVVPDGKTIRLHAAYDCESGAYRAWRAVAEGYAEVEGLVYLGLEQRYHNLYCS